MSVTNRNAGMLYIHETSKSIDVFVCVLSDVTEPGQLCVFIVLRSWAAHMLVNTYPLTPNKSVWHLRTIWGEGCH